MFRENKRHQQVTLFGIVSQLPVGVKKMLDKSWFSTFRKLIFEKIDERRYTELYSEVASCPTLPGECLGQMRRLPLLIKVRKNLYRDLPETAKECWKPFIAEYIEEEAAHVSFRLRLSEVEEHLKKVGELLFKLQEAYAQDEEISGLKSYQHVGQVLKEQFKVLTGKERTTIEVKPTKEISASSLQNPADEEATFRRQGEEEHQGYLLNELRPAPQIIRCSF